MLYEKVSKDAEIVGLLSKIDKTQEDYLPSDHGTRHAMFCVNFVEKILSELGCDDGTIDLGKVAAILHDVGCLEGKENHVHRSAVFAEEYLSKFDINGTDKRIIVEAIANHSAGKEMNHVVTGALVLADKCHWSRDRLHSKSDMENIVHISVDKIIKIDGEIDGDNLVLTYHVRDDFLQEHMDAINQVKPVFPKIAEYFGKQLVVKVV